VLRIKSETHSKSTPEIGTIRDGIPEVRFYRGTEKVWNWRDLASTYVLHYYHALVPNFGGQSIGVWLEVKTKEENLGRTMSQEELIFELPNHYRVPTYL